MTTKISLAHLSSLYAALQPHIYPPPYTSLPTQTGEMAFIKLCFLLLLLFSFLLSLQGFQTPFILPLQQGVYQYPPLHLQATHGGKEGKTKRSWRRLMIGSTAPTCTYNECRGCKYKCRAEQVPVEGNDPIHSAYHYKCVCHRS
ncbi:EPIDERMAL PATTERNING FACTOR-like protein 9 [Hibiscus syriacus]|uniref:EPIDERMAL PATTERNING FACTOR-like protein 9 n=1 Tax=Hibiscus syriacus TaxID=106335 RepID=UPI0019213CF1|nr:EPIDERMAL PATTERNING FACTOR-like protein 9 [Hibiscus syriacus]